MDVRTSTATVTTDSVETITWLHGVTVQCYGTSAAMRAAEATLRQFGATVGAGEDPTTGPDVDIVLVDRIETAPVIPGLFPPDAHDTHQAEDYLARVQRTNRSVWVTVSSFGIDGDRGNARGSELTVEASGGFLAHARFDAALPPTVTPGHLGLRMVGIAFAVAALHGLHTFRRDREPLHVDVSAQAVLVSTGLALEMGHVLADCPGGGGSIRYGAPTGFFQCEDGHVYVCVLEQHQWEGLCNALAPRLDSIPTLEEGRDRPDEVNAAMTNWVRDKLAAEAEKILQSAGVPCTSVNSVSTFINRTLDSGRCSGFHAGTALPLPAVVTDVAGKVSEPRMQTVIDLKDLRVLDAGNVLAVPLGAAWLGAMGARVTKMEDPQRLDVYRRRGPFAPGEPDLNRSGYFNHINYSKTGMDITVDEQGSSLDLTKFDVVIQNVTKRRASSVGIDAASVTAEPTPKLSLTSSGFGRVGPWADYRAYGHNVHAFSGVTASTRNPLNDMADMGVPVADVLTSVALNAWVLAWALAPTHDASAAVDISMAELIAAQLIELDGVSVEDAYRAPAVGGDVFVRIDGGHDLAAVSLRDRADVEQLEAIVGEQLPAITRRGQLIDLDPTDDIGSVADLDDRLRALGVPAALVLSARDLATDSFLRSTGLIQSVRSSAMGKYDVVGLPWSFVGRDREAVFAAPERP
ncbi:MULTISPECIES: CoA transferase [unclassified Rhodococcus (in: high G+C Gram-positive bacteria)]|uniref:CoA transferase n=1 Tax=unclassified Rhodococcus (in: high G+C Gram-positive bacteria) TaxID=192944 RepID=UPI000700D80D|nr:MULTISPECIES: CoA transferase [unclassified Rhodococcus (in: high G+C Gram-positive bacteria)]KQU28447.1 hypothetical protein ASG69_10580 [Rhodococcus sp. Leaf225]KQU47674.1 hypothetical protein ASH03_21480 [Rhodococcus sp. Leaf258]